MVIVSTITSHNVFSQLLEGGQNPASVKFRQINTPNFQILYPTLFESEAQRIANILNSIVADVSKSLGSKPRPISIILQTQGVVSNGFVTMAPRHSEFYTIPGQEFDTQDWLNSLAVHELRHVVQFDKLAPNLTAPLFEELKLAIFGINLPPWFFEGDAVAIETVLTEAGRGRLPAFEMVLRANELSGKNYSYSKNYLGSFKNPTPGYYPLGYFMTTKIRRDHGAFILDQILDRIKRFPVRPYNFSSSLKKYAGIHTKTLYQNTMLEMDSLWKIQADKVKSQTYPILNKIDAKNPSSYLLPYALPSGEIICLKTSLSETPRIVLLHPDKTEQTILKIGGQTEPNLNYANGKITWDEYRSDPRFDQRNYSVICTYDLKSKKYKQITRRSRLFSPALSPDGKRIIAVKVSTENIFNLVALDANTGEEIHVFPNADNWTLQKPAYNEAGDEIVVAAVSSAGKTLLRYRGDLLQELLPPEHQLISNPQFYKNQIIYKAHYNGVENIYALDIETKKINSLTNVRFGASYPSVDAKSNELHFSDYAADGYNVSKLNLTSINDTFNVSGRNTFVEYYSPLLAQENKPIAFETINQTTYQSEKYNSFKHPFYFHSARIVASKNEWVDDYDLGINFISNNKLNTVASVLGYTYNRGLRKSEYSASLAYLKYYPKFSLRYENRARMAYAKSGSLVTPTVTSFTWRENYTSVNMEIPFYINWLNKGLNASVILSTSYTNRYEQAFKPPGFNNEIKLPMHYKFLAGYNSRRSMRDLAPKWGQNMSIDYQHFPFDQHINGENLYVKTVFYSPGIFRNHSFRSSLNWQSNNGVYHFDTNIPRANGWANMEGIMDLKNTLLLSYLFPITYPDWELGPLTYVKRIKGGLFADFENISYGNGLRGYGLSINADMNLLRFYLPNFDLGTKFIIPNKSVTKKPILEFSLNFNY